LIKSSSAASVKGMLAVGSAEDLANSAQS